MPIRVAQSALIVLFVVWAAVGSSHGSMLVEVCEKTSSGEQNCASYDILFYSVWQFVKFLNRYSVLITAIATGLIAAFTWTLWQATDKLRVASEKQSELTKVLERAYLSVEPGGIRPYAGEDNRISCEVIIQNAGNLTARNVAWFFNRRYSTNSREQAFPIDVDKLEGDIILVPKGTARKGAPYTNQEAFRRATDDAGPDQAWLYVWGRVTYHDGFTGDRYIDFCHRYNLRGASGYTVPSEHGRYHEHGNRTDEG